MKYLINDKEVAALRQLVFGQNEIKEKLASDKKHTKKHANFPFRFKTNEVMGATTANKAMASIYFFGGSTLQLIENDYVVDDSSDYASLASGSKGVCIASSAYHILNIFSTADTDAKSYMGLASTSYASTTINVVIDNLEPMDGIGTTLTTLTANNRFHWPLINNGVSYIKYNNHTSAYNLIQTECT